MKKVVQFGAGNIGRGFLGQLYWQSGWETVFVDVDPALVDALNERRGYQIHIVDKSTYMIDVSRVRAVDGRDTPAVAAEIEDADLLGTAVGVNALKFIAPVLAAGLERRAAHPQPSPISVIICENLLSAAAALRPMIVERLSPCARDYAESGLGLVESVVSRMVPVVLPEARAADSLYVAVEEYATLPVDRQGFVGEMPNIEGMVPYENLHAYEERKLFTHNCGHALCAYLGYQKGHTYTWEAIEDAEVRELTLAGLWESGRALMARHGFTQSEHEEHILDLLERFANRALGDTVARVARDPVRKLGRDDRLVGSARIALEYGIEPRNLARGIVSALRYDSPDDPGAVKLNSLLREEGIDHVLETICGLPQSSRIAELVKEIYT